MSDPNFKFKFGDSWLDIWDRPFQKGRIIKASGGTELVDFLIDPGASNSSIPIDILSTLMNATKGEEEEFIAQHGNIVTTYWYKAEFELSIAIGELDDEPVCHRFPGPVLAQLDKRHGVIGMDVLKFFNIRAIHFDYELEAAQLWRPTIEDGRFTGFWCDE